MTIVDHFSKYGFAYAIPDKKAEIIMNYMVQAFVIGDTQMLYIDNGKEFVNELLTNWLEKRNIKQKLGGKYHPQSRGAVESFNKTIQKIFNETYTNSMFNGDDEWSLPLMVISFTITIAKEFVQQQRWFQEKFYSISKEKAPQTKSSWIKKTLERHFYMKLILR